MTQLTPLQGRRIVLTRDREGTARLASRLKGLGAEVLQIPLLEVRSDLDRERAVEVFREFASYEWLVFTSRNGVRCFFEAFFQAFDDIRSLGFVRIAAVGKGTQEALAELHLRADLLAPRATGASLAEALAAEATLDNLKLLVITGNRNREELVESLWEQRAIVDTLRVYTTGFRDLAGDTEAARFRADGADAVIFASPSAVQAFGEQAQHLTLVAGARIPALMSFGPSTSDCMRKAGIPVAAEAADPGLDGMVATVLDYFNAQS